MWAGAALCTAALVALHWRVVHFLARVAPGNTAAAFLPNYRRNFLRQPHSVSIGLNWNPVIAPYLVTQQLYTKYCPLSAVRHTFSQSQKQAISQLRNDLPVTGLVPM